MLAPVWKMRQDPTVEKHADFVNNNPGAFSNAYFELGSVRVYQ